MASRGHYSPGHTRRWGPENTAFAVALTTAGLLFTLAQLRGLTRATDLYEARKRKRRLLLVRERATIRRVDTYPYN